MNMDMSQYLDVFLEESKEHLGSLNQKLLDLEKNPNNLSALNEIFRAAHTLKGMSSTMGYEDMADLTHHMENVLVDLKEGTLTANSAVVDVLFKCFDRIQLMVENIENTGSGSLDNNDLVILLENIKKGELLPENKAFTNQNSMLDKVIENNELGEELSLNDYDRTIIEEAHSRGFKIYRVKVSIDPSCLMKAVRAFMVFKAVEEEGEIIKSVPAAQELDEGRFENDFIIFAISHLESDTLEEIIANISEVKVDSIDRIDIDQISSKKAEL